MNDLNPTEEERRLILRYRLQQVKRKATQEKVIALLKTAADYKEWLRENEAKDTFRAFCEDFGYLGTSEEEDRLDAHYYVVKLMDMAHNFIANAPARAAQ